MTESITVLKRGLNGEVTWQYTGIQLQRTDNSVRLEARFNRPDTPFHGTVLKENDRFLETFYTDRWYNIFEIHDRDDDHLKGWYCNLGLPAVWVAPDGMQKVLDQDEFEQLGLDQAMRAQVSAALADLQQLFRNKRQDGS